MTFRFLPFFPFFVSFTLSFFCLPLSHTKKVYYLVVLLVLVHLKNPVTMMMMSQKISLSRRHLSFPISLSFLFASKVIHYSALNKDIILKEKMICCHHHQRVLSLVATTTTRASSSRRFGRRPIIRTTTSTTTFKSNKKRFNRLGRTKRPV